MWDVGPSSRTGMANGTGPVPTSGREVCPVATVLVCDDSALVRENLHRVLASVPESPGWWTPPPERRLSPAGRSSDLPSC